MKFEKESHNQKLGKTKKKTYGRGRQFFKGTNPRFFFEFIDEYVLDEELLLKEFDQDLEVVRKIIRILLQ